jgi:predicted aldo/keto reductase-like oxidoreductase
MKDPGDGLRRREFLQRGVAATLGACALGLGGDGARAAEEPRVRRRVVLGRTGLEISDISIGTSQPQDQELIRYALDRGINYVDTAEGYPLGRTGEAEEKVGAVLRGRREGIALASKVKARANDGRQELMDRLEKSLRRLQTDRIDVYFNHAVNDLERLRNPEWFEFAELAKKQGKIRFTGISGHGGRLIECVDAALDEDLVDVILVAHNFGQDVAFYQRFLSRFDFVANQQGLPRVLEKAHAKGVGVIAMKTLMGARLNDMRPYEWTGSTFAQAAFRWVLSSPNVDALIVSMTSREQVDEYLGASGRGAVREGDLQLLRRYARRNHASYCRPACGACATSCPRGVPISELLRARMYAVDYRNLDLARGTYRSLGASASACLSCATPSCLGACPHGLDIPQLAASASHLLESA